ncbi:TetR/AcrR family transcriptional regulator, partial [Ilumatobacter sp.]|uniref:TetR/AcrR family transcriptional regulator n=1 Tax=Ilumatobacter sp. TaxID=1967498 RepID=UPI003AF65DE3
LVESGYERVTMAGIASRAGSSKETLYNWFGSKEGLFSALITANADESAARVRDALEGEADPRDTLVAFATGLLALLTSPGSVALNRAALTSRDLATVLLANGRHRVGPLVETYLGRLAERGEIVIDDPGSAFQLLYGLAIKDIQIRVLLGEPAPPIADLAVHASQAVDRFLTLTRP